MRILLTGAGGFLGQGIRDMLSQQHHMVCMDVVPVKNRKENETIISGSVTNLDDVARAMNGVDALVIAHMLSRTEDRKAYEEDPSLPFDVNVKGTAILFQEAVRQGVKRVILISSASVVQVHKKTGTPIPHDVEPVSSGDLYVTTKVCQEKIAEGYHIKYGIETAVLRIGGVCRVDDRTKKVYPKYAGVQWIKNEPSLVERRDVGKAVKQSLALETLSYEKLFVISSSLADHVYHMEYTRNRLNWHADYDFSWLPEETHVKS